MVDLAIEMISLYRWTLRTLPQNQSHSQLYAMPELKVSQFKCQSLPCGNVFMFQQFTGKQPQRCSMALWTCTRSVGLRSHIYRGSPIRISSSAQVRASWPTRTLLNETAKSLVLFPQYWL